DPQGGQPFQQGIHQHGAAMALQLEHRFTGKRARSRKIKRQSLIDGATVIITKSAQYGLSGRWQTAQYMPCNMSHPRAGYANYGDTGSTTCTGLCGNGIDRL